MLCSSEQPLMGRNLDTKSSYKGDNAPQNILKIKCPRLVKNAFAMQHLLHHSIIYTFIYYHTMNEDGCISELHPCTWGTQGPAPGSRQHLYRIC